MKAKSGKPWWAWNIGSTWLPPLVGVLLTAFFALYGGWPIGMSIVSAVVVVLVIGAVMNFLSGRLGGRQLSFGPHLSHPRWRRWL